MGSEVAASGRVVALLGRKGREENPAQRAFAAHLNGVVGALFKTE